MTSLLRTTLVFGLLGSLAVGQVQLSQSTGSLPASRHGHSVTMLDYDGLPGAEVVVGEPGDNGAAFVARGGSASVFDSTGLCIAAFYGLADEQLGTCVQTLPDMNGDGVSELALGAVGWPATSPGVQQSNGKVYIYWGGTPAACANPAFRPPDLTIDAGPVPLGQLGTDAFGSEIAVLGDLQGDGATWLAIGAPGGFLPTSLTDDPGYVSVYRIPFGLPPVLVYTIYGPANDSDFGRAITRIDDVTGDGVDDFAVGSPLEDIGFMADAGRVRLYDSLTGAPTNPAAIFDGRDGARFGHDLAWLGDLDGDGMGELAVGAPWDGSLSTFTWIGSVTVLPSFSLSNPAAPSQPTPVKYWANDLDCNGNLEDNDLFGYSLANVGDLDADGFDDLAVGAPGDAIYHPDYVSPTGVPGTAWPDTVEAERRGMVRLLSGGRETVIQQIWSPAHLDGGSFGTAVAGGGDIDDDGVPDFVVGAPWENLGQAGFGTAWTYSGVIRFGRVYGAGNTANLEVTGVMGTAGNSVTFLVTGAAPNRAGQLFYGPLQQPGVTLPGSNGLLYIDGSGGLFRGPIVFTDATGSVPIPLDLTMPPQPAGQITPCSRWNFQFWYRDVIQGQTNLSDAVTVGFF